MNGGCSKAIGRKTKRIGYIRAMARVNSNPIIDGLSGKLSNVVFKTYRYGTVISKRPDMSKVKRTKVQKKNTSRFAEAVQYARSISVNPTLLKRYQQQAKRTGRTLYHLALADYMHDRTKTLAGITLAPASRKRK